MDQLQQSLAAHTSVSFVDLRPVLIGSKHKAREYWDGNQEEARLYWQTDSHWNGAGADIAQYTVGRHIEKILPGLITPRLRDKENFQMVQGKGDLASLINDESLFAEKGPAFRQGTCSKATPEEYRKKHQVATCREGKISAIIFHDSFFTALKPFFADYFSTTVFLWEGLNQKALQKNIAKYKPAIVIEQMAERFLPYVPDITRESYGAFWGDLFGRSNSTLYRLDAGKASRGSGGYESANLKAHVQKLDGSLKLSALNGDPYLHLPDITFKAGRLYVLKIKITAPAKTTSQIFFSRRGKENLFPSVKDSAQFQVNKGNNTLYIPLISGDLGYRFRFDPGTVKGGYTIKAFEIREVGLEQIP